MEVKFEPDKKLKHKKPDWAICLADFLRDSNQTFSGVDIRAKLKLELYPSILDLCKLASIAYFNLEKAENEMISSLPDYKIVCHAKHGSFHASAFWREGSISESRHRQLIIAFEGTNYASDWIHANLQGIAKNQITPQLNSACTFALQILDTVQKTLDTKSDPLQIIITGHSLGGWLAQVATFAVKYLEFGYANMKFIRRADPDLWHPHCVVFDSPGAYLMLSYLNSYSELRENHDSHTLTLDICNYVIYPNVVNVINPPFGDMVQIIAPDSIPAFEQISSGRISKYSSIYKHTFKFHDIELFISALGNSPISYYRVINWPMVVFQGSNSYANKDKGLSKVLMEVAIFVWKGGDVLDELFTCLSNQNGSKCYKTGLLDDGEINLATTRLSVTERTSVEKLGQIRLWKQHIGHVFHDKMQAMKFSDKLTVILEMDYKYRVENGRMKFEDRERYNILKNCCSFNLLTVDLLTEIENLPDYDLANIFLTGERYCDEMLCKYSIMKLGDNSKLNISPESIQRKFEILNSNDKSWLRLILLTYVFLKSSGFLNMILIMKHDQWSKLYERNTKLQQYGIQLVIIDSIDDPVSCDKIKEMSCISGINYVWVQESIDSTHRDCFTEKFEVDDELMGSILGSEVTLQGRSHFLKNIFTGEDQRQELRHFLESSPSSLLAILRGNAEIGPTLKNVFDLENTYFNIARKMNGTQLGEYYSKKVNKFETIVVFQCDCDEFMGRKKIMEHLGLAAKVRIHVLQRDTPNPFKEFQNICKANNTCIVDFVNYNNGSNLSYPFELRYQYTPEFYIKREIRKPGLNLGKVCSYLKAKKGIKSFYLGRGKAKVDIEFSENDWIDNTSSKTDIEIVKKFEGIICNAYKSATFDLNPEGSEHTCIFEQSSDHVSPKPDLLSDLQTRIQFSTSPVPEGNISFCDDGPLIVSDEPGMGKSTTVVQLANRILNQSFSSSDNLLNFIIIIDLKSLENLDLIDLNSNGDSFVNSFCHCISVNLKFNELSKYFFSHVMLNESERSKVTILADGFDEMTNQNKELWIIILRKTRGLRHIQIIISTRIHDKKKLESVLGVLSHSFVPLLNNERIQFLVNLWAPALRVETDLEVGHLEKFATEVINEAHQHLVAGREEFLGVPLQLKMLSEGFFSNAMEYVASGGEKGGIAQIREKLTLAYIYQRFIDRKYNIYMTQKLGIPSGVNTSITQEHFDEYLYKFAGHVLYCEEQYETLVLLVCGKKLLFPQKHVIEKIFRVGIAIGENEMKIPIFIHRTFAEFYVAKFCANVVEKICYSENDNSDILKGLKDVLIEQPENRSKMVFVFLNDMIKDLRDRGMGYGNFVGSFPTGDLRLYELLPRVVLDDFFELVINVCIMPGCDLNSLFQSYNIDLACIYVTESTTFYYMVFILRRILMLNHKLQFRDVKFFNASWVSQKGGKLSSINEHINELNNPTHGPDGLKELIMEDPLAYVIFTDSKRDEILTCLENYVLRNELSHENLRKIVPHSDHVRVDWEEDYLDYIDISPDKSLVGIIEQRSGVNFTPEETQELTRFEYSD